MGPLRCVVNSGWGSASSTGSLNRSMLIIIRQPCKWAMSDIHLETETKVADNGRHHRQRRPVQQKGMALSQKASSIAIKRRITYKSPMRTTDLLTVSRTKKLTTHKADGVRLLRTQLAIHSPNNSMGGQALSRRRSFIIGALPQPALRARYCWNTTSAKKMLIEIAGKELQ